MLTAKPVVRGHAPSFDLVAEQLHKDPWFLRCGAFCCRRYCGWVFALALTLSVGIGLVLVWDPPYAVSGHKPNTTEMLGSVISRTQQNAAAAVERLEAVQDALHADATPEELLHRLDRLGLLDEQMQGQMLNLQQTLAAYSFANGTHQSPEGNASSTSVIAVQVQQLSQNSSWENLTAEAIDSRQFVFSGNWKFDLFRFAHHGGDAAYMMRPMATAGRRMQAKSFETVRNSFAQLSKSWRVFLISIAGACGLVFSMNAGPWGRQGPHPPQQHQRQNVHIGDAGPPFVGTANLKVPPAWTAERAHWYSLRSWLSDLVLWASATDLDPVMQGPVAALQITGAAREIVREIPPQHLRDGVQDPQQGHIPGLMLLARALTDRYGPLESEVATRAISELVTFTRMQGESVDALLVRFEVLRVRAQQRGGLGINAQGLSWMLLNALRLPPEMWDRLLPANQGILPQDEQQLAALCDRIRRTGHLLEGGYHRHPGQGATGDPGHFATAGNGFFPVFAASDQDHGASAYFGDDAPSAAAGAASSGLDRVTGAAGGITSSNAMTAATHVACISKMMSFQAQRIPTMAYLIPKPLKFIMHSQMRHPWQVSCITTTLWPRDDGGVSLGSHQGDTEGRSGMISAEIDKLRDCRGRPMAESMRASCRIPHLQATRGQKVEKVKEREVLGIPVEKTAKFSCVQSAGVISICGGDARRPREARLRQQPLHRPWPCWRVWARAAVLWL